VFVHMHEHLFGSTKNAQILTRFALRLLERHASRGRCLDPLMSGRGRMRVESDVSWVIPFLDDVAEFLAEHGMSDCSSIVAEAAIRVQRCSLIEGAQQQADDYVMPLTTANIVSLSPRHRVPR
jgi:hypothetical protein